ncbi:MAG: DNA primase [Candidatus Kerfeldbacteria bacterium]|nr:DNA primase [Candidatus Kerfeldbacteria bacterium]
MASPEVIQQIKSRLDVVEVIGEYVRLKQAGQNWKGLCPFHQEKTPSFVVSKERQMWYCFGCNSGGDIFEFIERLEGLEFPEVLEMLARRAQVTLDKTPGGEPNQRLRLLNLLEQAQKFYNEQLAGSAPAQAVRDYLVQRQITADSLKTFGLGYAPAEWDKLSNYLRSQKFSVAELVAAGVAVKSERGPGVYDRFRERLMFPITDVQGRVVGFGGRVLDKEAKEAKYINSPQGPVYNKSLIVYNLDRAKAYIKEAGFAVLVEGYMDVIGSWQAGVRNVAATSGTALTLEQIKLIKRYTSEVRVAFDADLAGKSAAERGIDLALTAEMEVKVIALPFGKDPDECAKQDQVAWQTAVTQALPIVDHAFMTVLKQVDASTREGKKTAAASLLRAIAKLPDPVEQDYYLKKLAQEIGVDELALRQRFGAQASSFKKESIVTPAVPVVVDRQRLIAERLLALLLRYTDGLSGIMTDLPAEMLGAPELSELYRRWLIYYNKVQDFEIDEFRQELQVEAEMLRLLDVLSLRVEGDLADLPEDEAVKEGQVLLQQIKQNYFSQELKQLSAAIREAEKQGSAAELQSLLARFNEISQQLSSLQS